MTRITNETRAEQMDRVLAEYCPNCSADESLIDLLTDAMHWCSLNGVSFDPLLNTARMHFDLECEPLPGEGHDAIPLDALSPLPWVMWRLAPESDREERPIIVTADGEQEITSFVHRMTDAVHIVRSVNLHSRLVGCLEECARLLADFDECEGEEGDAFRAAVRILELARRS